MVRQRTQLERDHLTLERERDRLKRHNERLKQQLEAVEHRRTAEQSKRDMGTLGPCEHDLHLSGGWRSHPRGRSLESKGLYR